jgi:glycosyltransferase involved in cell wall biosynthesis
MARPVRYFLTRHHFNPIKSNALYEWALAEAQALIAVSESVRGQLAAAFPKLVDRVVVIPNWIDTRRERMSREEARTRLGIRRPLAAGIIGQLTPLKRQDLFIRAAVKLVKEKKLTNAEFLVIGEAGPDDGGYDVRLRELVKKTGVDGHVWFTGYVDGLPELLAALDVVAVVSRNEGFSLALVEAMAAGCAVIATRAGGMAEIVKDGVTGMLIEPDDEAALIDALSGLLDDKLRRAELGRVARLDVVERFDREKVIDLIERLYLKRFP